MDQEAIVEYIRATFKSVDIQQPTDGPGAGDTFFIYDPRGDLEPKQQFPFATIVTKNYGEFDDKSNLDRPGVFRLNIGVGRDTFRARVDPDADYDYAAFDRLMPHPVYAAQSWLSVLNPSAETFHELEPLLAEAYQIAVTRLERHEDRG
jgi:uncharacterized protein DUF6194